MALYSFTVCRLQAMSKDGSSITVGKVSTGSRSDHGFFSIEKVRWNHTVCRGAGRLCPLQRWCKHSTTDETLQGNVDIGKKLSKRWDLTLDYSYAQYGANFGGFSPKTFGIGLMFHFDAPMQQKRTSRRARSTR